MVLPELDTDYVTTRQAMHTVAIHIVARARIEATGRFGLRLTASGFGTPEFGDEPRRVRVSRGSLVFESGAGGAPLSRSLAIDGSTLDQLAVVAGVDLGESISVGHGDADPVDRSGVMRVRPDAADALMKWFGLVGLALDGAAASRGADGTPSMVQLWPEHFDVALDVAFDPGEPTTRRVNLGGSAGDDFESMPYAYVGPWTADRPGDTEFWNAPFGAVLRYADVASSNDPFATVSEFFRAGLCELHK